MDRKNITSLHLLEEIIEEILSRLPVKSLVRFSCVSKSWLSLITSERFIETHLRNSAKNRAFSHHKVIFSHDLVLNECSLQQLLNEASSIEPSPIYHPTNNQLMRGVSVLGCCNGLICLRKGLDFFLWNPATRICVKLPELDLVCIGPSKVGFGWDGRSGAYKVFMFMINRHGIGKSYIYSLKTNSWKIVELGSFSFYDRIGVFACGKILWLADNADYIESFDLESEEIGRIELPFNQPKFPRRRYTLAQIMGCLHLLCVYFDDDDDDNQQSYAVVWIMKESGWLKLFTFPLVFEPRYLPIRLLFGGGPNGKILLIIHDNFLVYDGKDVIVLQPGESKKHLYRGHVYVESLVSPKSTTVSSIIIVTRSAPVDLLCKAEPPKMDGIGKNIKSLHLLEEVIEEILSRLPVKSLLRFRCVSKSWLSLIRSKQFIKTHLRNSTKNTAFSHHKVIFHRDLVLNECSLHQLLNEPSSIEPSPIYDPTNNQLMRGVSVLGCCNGLICLRKGLDFFLWNPATRICVELPELDLVCIGPSKVGFGWDGRSGAYKVFMFLINQRGIGKSYIYSSKTNSWKIVELGCFSFYDRIGVFACGKILWLADNVEYIESFDLESEEFGRIELPFNPPKFPRRCYTLAEIGGCLHLLCVYFHDDDEQSYAVVWVKKEFDWLKLFTFPLVYELRFLPIRPLFWGGPNGKILLIIYENFFVYDGKDVIVPQAGENKKYLYRGHVYIESLVSPNFTIAS